MNFPLQPLGDFGRETGLALGVVFGMAFGFVLERAGFGRASNLAAQFYGGDNRVLKVMFTGIATTVVLLGLLSSLGMLALDQLTVPETWIGPQIVGGLLLGAGFVVAGYCPGTGVVAAASGSIDGMVTYFGVMLGTLVFGAAWPYLEGFYESGSLGSVRLDQVMGLPFPVVALMVVALAVGAFASVERLERWLAKRRAGTAPDHAPILRNASLGIVGLVAAVSTVMGMTQPAAAQPERPAPGAVGAFTLATQIVEDPASMWIVDLRDPTACQTARIPGATCRPADDADAQFLADLPASRTLVVYGGAELVLPAGVGRWQGDVEVLTGGYAAFQRDVLTAPVLPPDPTLAQLHDWQRRSAIQGYLTGSTVAAPPVAVTPRKAPAAGATKKGGGC